MNTPAQSNLSRFQLWHNAIRPPTLLLALSGGIFAGSMAVYNDIYNSATLALLLITAALLQLISNFANYYDDFATKGIENRLSPKAISRVLVATTLFAIIFGLALLYQAFKYWDSVSDWLVFIGLGVAGIWAAYKYSLGKKPYGYLALGDLMVLIFFGLINVLGSYYLLTHRFELSMLFPALSIGLLAVAVLNVNNIRDIEKDAKNNKQTVARLLGPKRAVAYHYALIILAALFTAFYVLWEALPIKSWMFVFALPALFGSAILVKQYPDDIEIMNFQLSKTAIASFAFSVLLAFGIVL